MRQLKITQSITSREGDSLERYLQEINKEPMITPEEEVVLAHRIHNGDDEALEQLTKANLRFVVSVAKQYQGQGLGLIDLINEGNVGLITAAKKFDETRGFKFISYAVWWIRQSILQALAENSRLVYLPLNQVNNLTKIHRFLSDFAQKNERTPSNEEIAEALDIDVEKVKTIMQSSGRPTSMDAPLADDEGSCLLDLVLQLQSYVAQLEREHIRERQRQGIEAAMARGVRFGRPPHPRPEGYPEVAKLVRGGEISQRGGAAQLEVSVSTFRRWLEADRMAQGASCRSDCIQPDRDGGLGEYEGRRYC